MQSTAEENAALVRRFLTDVLGGGDTDAVDGFVAGNVADWTLSFAEAKDRDVVTALAWRVLAAADVDVTIEDVVASGDRVAVRATVAGAHRESLVDLAPTGRSFEIAYAWFCRIDDGRIVKVHSLPDELALLQQIGALPDEAVNRPQITANDHL